MEKDQNQGGMTGSMTDRPGYARATPFWRDYENKYKGDWEGRFQDKPWMEHHSAFRYGWEAGANPQFKGRNFTDMESELGRDWPNRYNRWGDSFQGNRIEQVWNDFKDTVREGWDKARMEFKEHF